MENLKQNEQVGLEETKPSQLHTITPLSKYLALALFVALPFIGGWIGYTYAPVAVVEVEKTIVKEVPLNSSDLTPTNTNKMVSVDNKADLKESATSISPFIISSSTKQLGWKTYRNENYNFEISFPSSFTGHNNGYYPDEPIFQFTEPKSELIQIFILPKGGADYGLEGVDFTSEEIKMGDNFETKQIAIEDGFYREFVYFSSSSIPVSWNNLNRIEVRIDEPNELTDKILSTFDFIE